MPAVMVILFAARGNENPGGSCARQGFAEMAQGFVELPRLPPGFAEVAPGFAEVAQGFEDSPLAIDGRPFGATNSAAPQGRFVNSQG